MRPARLLRSRAPAAVVQRPDLEKNDPPCPHKQSPPRTGTESRLAHDAPTLIYHLISDSPKIAHSIRKYALFISRIEHETPTLDAIVSIRRCQRLLQHAVRYSRSSLAEN